MNYLKHNLSTVPKEISVQCGEWAKRVEINIGTDKQAVLTKNWLSVSRHLELEEGNVLIFSFCTHRNNVVGIFVDEIFPCEECADP